MIKFFGRRGYISQRDVGMIKRKKTVKEYAKRLKKLASKHLHCTLDDNEPGYIPPDIKEGTYRWTLYIYSNLYTEDNDEINSKDREMFIHIASTFQELHLISWTRDTLVELDGSKVGDILNYLVKRIDSTTSFFELKTALYAHESVSNSSDRGCVVDPFIIKKHPGLEKYVKK